MFFRIFVRRGFLPETAETTNYYDLTMKKYPDILRGFFLALAILTACNETQAQEPQRLPHPLLTVSRSGHVGLKKGHWSDFVGKGKHTLVVFWVSGSEEGCAECVNIQRIHEKYRSKGLTVLGVPMDELIDDTTAVMEEYGITFPQLFDVDNEPSGYFEFGSIPFVVLLDPQGNPVEEGLSGEGIEQAVRSCLR